MKYKLDKSAHSVYSLHYHLLIVIKYRRKALYDEVIRERLKHIIWSLTDELGIEILAQEPAEDHLHVLFTATPTTNLSNVVNVIKGVHCQKTPTRISTNQGVPVGRLVWSNSYFISSTGQVSLDVLMQYVGISDGESRIVSYKYPIFPNKDHSMEVSGEFGCV